MNVVWEQPSVVAQRINVHVRTLRRWCARGIYVAKTVPGGRWRVKVDSDGWPVEP